MKMTQGNFEAMKSIQETSNKNHEASIKNLEVQIGQLSRQFSTLQNNGGFGGNTQDNPKNENCKAFNLRNRVVPSPEVRESSKKESKNVVRVELKKKGMTRLKKRTMRVKSKKRRNVRLMKNVRVSKKK
ncbi:hypothetical protein A2U01_0023848 [Trifolium medium]|uniref:Uncharacterized protein n=1 Tax=Trifolium medium TaxID=97028 RepID=A0A392NTT8_9FABA|nr:hypothetical protein [Trifolium medium]